MLDGLDGRALRRHRPPRWSAGADPVALTAAHADRVVARAPQGRRRRARRPGHRRRAAASATPSSDGHVPCRSARATSTSRPWSRTLEAAGYQRLVRARAGRDARRRARRRGPGRRRPRLPRLPARGGRMTAPSRAAVRGPHHGPGRRRHLPRAGRRRARGRRRRSASSSAAARPTSPSPPPGTAAAPR